MATDDGYFENIAQLVGHTFWVRKVVGSNPTVFNILKPSRFLPAFFFRLFFYSVAIDMVTSKIKICIL